MLETLLTDLEQEQEKNKKRRSEKPFINLSECVGALQICPHQMKVFSIWAHCRGNGCGLLAQEAVSKGLFLKWCYRSVPHHFLPLPLVGIGVGVLEGKEVLKGGSDYGFWFLPTRGYSCIVSPFCHIYIYIYIFAKNTDALICENK